MIELLSIVHPSRVMYEMLMNAVRALAVLMAHLMLAAAGQDATPPLTASNAVSSTADVPDWLQGKDLYPTYAEGVGLIFENRCISCHREGESAPMSLMTYDEIREWVKGAYTPMDAIITSREMPPWPADPEIGHFTNSQSMTAREIELISQWIEDGLPYGDDDFEPTKTWTEGWNIGKPDVVFELPATRLPAGEEYVEKSFEVKTDFDEDRWVVACEARPGNDAIVASIEGGPLGTYTPGNSYEVLPPGAGRRIRAGETITVRVRYAKAKGSEASDQSKLGVVFGTAQQTIHDVVATPTTESDIRPMERTRSHELKRESQSISLLPILGKEGATLRIRSSDPSGTQRDLLWIPNWNPGWVYRYAVSGKMAAGTRIEATATFAPLSDEATAKPTSSPQLPPGEFTLILGLE